MIMQAFRLPKKTEKDILNRNNAILNATKNAIEVPLRVMELSLDSLKLSKKISKIGNKNSLSDAGVASEMAISSLNGAYMNVLINLKDLEDPAYMKKIIKKANSIVTSSKKEIEMSREYLYKNLWALILK